VLKNISDNENKENTNTKRGKFHDSPGLRQCPYPNILEKWKVRILFKTYSKKSKYISSKKGY
jgi:hypothetical protein